MTSKPDADARLIGAHDLAQAALREITPASSIGPAAGYLPEADGSVSLRFENRLPGYPGWYWIVTVARVDDEDPTVLEIELLPGDGALLAPEWVPWAERLAEYRAHQVELAEAAAAAGDGEAPDADELDESEDDVLDGDDLDDDDDDLDEDDRVADILHAGDLDGVDIDELDDSAAEDDETEDDETEDDETEDDESDALDEDAGEVDEEE